MCGTECAQLEEDGQRPPRCTSTTSSQSEPSEQLRRPQGKSLASEDPKKKRAQKPSHMRRNIRWVVLRVRGEGKEERYLHLKAVTSSTGLSRRVPFPKKKSVSCVPQLIVEMHFRTTPGCQTLWGKSGGRSGYAGEFPTLWRPWGQPKYERVLLFFPLFSPYVPLCF